MSQRVSKEVVDYVQISELERFERLGARLIHHKVWTQEPWNVRRLILWDTIVNPAFAIIQPTGVAPDIHQLWHPQKTLGLWAAGVIMFETWERLRQPIEEQVKAVQGSAGASLVVEYEWIT